MLSAQKVGGVVTRHRVTTGLGSLVLAPELALWPCRVDPPIRQPIPCLGRAPGGVMEPGSGVASFRPLLLAGTLGLAGIQREGDCLNLRGGH